MRGVFNGRNIARLSRNQKLVILRCPCSGSPIIYGGPPKKLGWDMLVIKCFLAEYVGAVALRMSLLRAPVYIIWGPDQRHIRTTTSDFKVSSIDNPRRKTAVGAEQRPQTGTFWGRLLRATKSSRENKVVQCQVIN